MKFYIGLGLQLVGFASVTLCLYSGLTTGDYGQLELIQFLGGAGVFYIGTAIRSK